MFVRLSQNNQDVDFQVLQFSVLTKLSQLLYCSFYVIWLEVYRITSIAFGIYSLCHARTYDNILFSCKDAEYSI